MSDTVIQVENLGKQYRIGQRESYLTFRETITKAVRAPFTRNKGDGNQTDGDLFWALKDVSFEVKRGEVLGIIGRNGAGKSTLLKILTRITEPTEGRATIHGRVASLLEVGTGFHPELTGRENIFLNGAILGMSKREIERKFDEIVAFSEIEKFLDTPVKRYSSGMYVRLAFAVAAHMEPEILLIDEVLAVGDAQFQKKCLGKMGDVASEGRTVLFVSHNMAAIQELCSRTIVLAGGHVVEDAPAPKAISDYLSAPPGTADGDLDLSSPSLRRNSLQDSNFKWTRIAILNSEGKPTTTVGLAEPFEMELRGKASVATKDLKVGFGVMSPLGFSLFNSYQIDAGLPTDYPPGESVFRVKFIPNIFGPGTYSIDVGANAPGTRDWIPDAIQFTVSEVGPTGDAWSRANYGGVVRYPCDWSIEG